MKTQDLLDEAGALVGGDRAEAHGDKARTHANIARFWNVYLNCRREPDAPISPADVAHMMSLLKLVRSQAGRANPDDHVDFVGYAAIGGELSYESQ